MDSSLINEEVIFKFFSVKFSKGLNVTCHSPNEGMTALVFDLHYNDELMGRVIKYSGQKTEHVVATYTLLSELSNWFPIGSHKGEKLFGEWLKQNQDKLLLKII